MARQRKRHLSVFLGRSLVGRLTRGVAGDMSFDYDAGWLSRSDALPVSLSLPLQTRSHIGQSVFAFFDNLLPDNDAIRKRIAEREGASSHRPFDLLAAIGRDCVGALRFLPDGADPGDPTRMESDAVSEAEIARRLRLLKQAPLGREESDADFRISIAGAQDKTAFLRASSGGWAIPKGATPTTHIFKPPIGPVHGDLDLSDSVENEWLSLAFCRELGLSVARADIARFALRHWIETADAGKLPRGTAEAILADLAVRIDPAIQSVADRLPPDFPLAMFDATGGRGAMEQKTDIRRFGASGHLVQGLDGITKRAQFAAGNPVR